MSKPLKGPIGLFLSYVLFSALIIASLVSRNVTKLPFEESTFTQTEIALPWFESWIPEQDNQAILTQHISGKFKVSENVVSEIVMSAFVEGQEHDVDPLLILAVVQNESSFNPKAKSGQDTGLMQINTKWQAELVATLDSPAMLAEPATNIKLGTQILAQYIEKSKGSEYQGLRRYNGWGKTNNYPSKVLNSRNELEKVLKAAQS